MQIFYSNTNEICYEVLKRELNFLIMKIFLIGFMGCGKSTIGRILAAELNYKFVDIDNFIEKISGLTISEIFSNQGENKFREYESEALAGICDKDNIVVATGGGTPCFYGNMKTMSDNGMTIYLKTESEILYRRLVAEYTTRPLLKGLSDEERKKYITTTLQEREPDYLKAKIVIETGNYTEQQLLNLILKEAAKIRSGNLS